MKHAKKSLETSVQTLGAVFKEVLPKDEVPLTIAGFAARLGPKFKTFKSYAQELMVRCSDSTFNLLLSGGGDADYESLVSDFPKKSDGRPSNLGKYSACASSLAKSSMATMERRSATIDAARNPESEFVV